MSVSPGGLRASRAFSCLEVGLEDLEGAACAGQGALFDPDTHHHVYLGGNPCWICDDAKEVCDACPVWEACFREGRRIRESHMIRAGFAWTNGRPRDLRKIKSR